MTLQDNGGDDLVVNADGTFTFPAPVPSGGTYAVTIKTQPSGPTQTCTLAGGERIDRRVAGHQRQRQLLDERLHDRRNRDGPDRQRTGHPEQRRR